MYRSWLGLWIWASMHVEVKEILVCLIGQGMKWSLRRATQCFQNMPECSEEWVATLLGRESPAILTFRGKSEFPSPGRWRVDVERIWSRISDDHPCMESCLLTHPVAQGPPQISSYNKYSYVRQQVRGYCHIPGTFTVANNTSVGLCRLWVKLIRIIWPKIEANLDGKGNNQIFLLRLPLGCLNLDSA